MDGISTIIISAILSVIVAYATTKASSYSKDVVAERKEWRDKIRQLSVDAVRMMQSGETKSPKFHSIFAEFRLRLNPDSSNDNQILETLKKCALTNDYFLREKFLAQVARLLKHDWERAKGETRLLNFCPPNEDEIRRLRITDY